MSETQTQTQTTPKPTLREQLHTLRGILQKAVYRWTLAPGASFESVWASIQAAHDHTHEAFVLVLELLRTSGSHLCTVSGCTHLRIEGSSFCWSHLTSDPGVCVVEGCKTATRPQHTLCTDHMNEYQTHATATGKYSIQEWLIRRGA